MLDRTTFIGLAATALVALPLANISRKAEAGESRTRTISSVLALTVVDMAMSIDGEEMDPERMRGLDVTSTTSFALTSKDTFESAADGRATKFVRTFDSIAQKSERSGGDTGGGGPGGGPGGGAGGDRGGPRELTTGLIGEDVVFTWDAEEDGYVPSLPKDSKLDAKLLEGLTGDIEFAQFLPSGDVEVGAEWDVPLDAFAMFIRPAGNLHLAPESTNDGGERRQRFGGRMGGGSPNPEDLGVEAEYSGSIKAHLVEMVEIDGGRGARIELVFDVTSKHDMADSIEPVTRETDRGDFTMTTLEAVLVRKLEGKGELVWNVGRGCLSKFALEADMSTIDTNGTETVVDGADSRIMQRETTSEGTLKFEYTIA